VPTEIKGLVVKIVQRCNLNCSYCYMYQHADQSWRQRPPFMSEEIFGHLLTRIEEYCDRRPGREMYISFHGGEPMLIGPRQFDRLVGMAVEKLKDRVSLGMQTNGTLVDDEWIEVLKRHNLRVGVSLDGPPEIHDLSRVDHAGRGSYREVVQGLRKLQENRVFSSVLTVINPGQSGLEIYRHIRSLGGRRKSVSGSRLGSPLSGSSTYDRMGSSCSIFRSNRSPSSFSGGSAGSSGWVRAAAAT